MSDIYIPYDCWDVPMPVASSPAEMVAPNEALHGAGTLAGALRMGILSSAIRHLCQCQRELLAIAYPRHWQDESTPHPHAAAVLREFPDYDGLDSLPAFPAHWTCEAWHKDAYPMWTARCPTPNDPDRLMVLGIDYLDSTRWEASCYRCIVSYTHTDCTSTDIHLSDDPAEALAFAEALLAREGRCGMIAFHPTREAAEAHILQLGGFLPAPNVPKSWRGDIGTTFYLDHHGRAACVQPHSFRWCAGVWLTTDKHSRTLARLNPEMVGTLNPDSLARAKAWLAKTGIA